jgi:hypothetical protein
MISQYFTHGGFCLFRSSHSSDKNFVSVLQASDFNERSKDGQLGRLERGLRLSGANITMSQQADQLRCPLFHASLVARCFTENQLSPFCWH